RQGSSRQQIHGQRAEEHTGPELLSEEKEHRQRDARGRPHQRGETRHCVHPQAQSRRADVHQEEQKDSEGVARPAASLRLLHAATFAPYLSPFYSPELFGDSPHSWFGPKPSWWPAWLVFSPALLVLWAPGGFRVTCYYYRGAYYKSFWADPPSCAVGEPRSLYRGEASLPLIRQNVHRYFLYLALPILAVLAGDASKALRSP